MSKLVCGVGVNDADYVVRITINNKLVWICPFYRKWTNMLARCYSVKTKERCPTYRGCYVCDEWLIFSNFKAWMEQQDWENKQLDKDILVIDNKVYSPDNCAFVDSSVNSFLTDHAAKRGEYPIGVYFHKTTKKFVAKVRVNGKRKHLGYFDDPNEAHLAWKEVKCLLALELAKEQTDPRVAEALIKRFK